MTSQDSALPADDKIENWIRMARTGSTDAVGRLLETCRPYLLLVANEELPSELRGKVGASDLVQETCLRAHRNFDDFHDSHRAELVAWLRRILLNSLADVRRRYCATDKRQLAREINLPVDVALEALNVPAAEASPSSMVAAAEQDAALQDALNQLPEQYRQVVM